MVSNTTKLPLSTTYLTTSYNTADGQLIDQLLHEPSISNVYVGNHPSTFAAHVLPHDGYLGDFLMRTKSGLGSLKKIVKSCELVTP
jgi:hypothetical protein